MTEPIRVVIADDHAVVRSGLRALFETVDDIEVVGEAGDGRAAVTLADEVLPDIVLMDIQMPATDGIEATRTITASHPSVAVVVLTMHEDADTLFTALRAGARGYLLKGAEQTDVLHCLRSVAAGHVTLGPGAAERVLEGFAHPGGPPAEFPELTERERSVLKLVADGHNNSVIATPAWASPARRWRTMSPTSSRSCSWRTAWRRSCGPGVPGWSTSRRRATADRHVRRSDVRTSDPAAATVSHAARNSTGYPRRRAPSIVTTALTPSSSETSAATPSPGPTVSCRWTTVTGSLRRLIRSDESRAARSVSPVMPRR